MAEAEVEESGVLQREDLGLSPARLGDTGTPLTCAAHGCSKTSATSTGSSWQQSGKTCWRCHECTSYAKRLSNALKLMQQEDSDAFRQKSKEETLAFKERNSHLIAAELPAALTTWVTEANAHVRVRSYYDDDDDDDDDDDGSDDDGNGDDNYDDNGDYDCYFYLDRRGVQHQRLDGQRQVPGHRRPRREV